MQKLSELAADVTYELGHDWRDMGYDMVELIKMGVSFGQLRHKAGVLHGWKLYFHMKFNYDDPTWVKEYIDAYLHKNWDAYNTKYFRAGQGNFYVLFDVAI